MFNIGTPELLVIFVIALVVVGPRRLPELARQVGRAMAELRKVQDQAKDFVKFDLDLNPFKTDALDEDDLKAPTPPPPPHRAGTPAEEPDMSVWVTAAPTSGEAEEPTSEQDAGDEPALPVTDAPTLPNPPAPDELTDELPTSE